MFRPMLWWGRNRVIYLHRNESWLVGWDGMQAMFPVYGMMVVRGTKRIRACEILRMLSVDERGSVMLIWVCGDGHLGRMGTSQGSVHVVVRAGSHGA